MLEYVSARDVGLGVVGRIEPCYIDAVIADMRKRGIKC